MHETFGKLLNLFVAHVQVGSGPSKHGYGRAPPELAVQRVVDAVTIA